MTTSHSSAAFHQALLQALAAHHEAGEAQAIARVYLETAWQISLTDRLLDKPLSLSPSQVEQWEQHLARLGQGEPLQYVLEQATFMGETWEVNPSVLIPRPETEGLVQWAVERAPSVGTRLLDAGTGSGCIAISLAQRLPQASVTAWDISPDALAVAQRNAQHKGVQVVFEQCDLLAQAQTPTEGTRRFDLMVSNPPYIRQKEMAEMETHVVKYEPHLALFVPDYDPLLFYRALAQLGQRLLESGGSLMVECHRDCVQQVADLFDLLGYERIETRRDCFDLPRLVAAVKA